MYSINLEIVTNKYEETHRRIKICQVFKDNVAVYRNIKCFNLVNVTESLTDRGCK